MKSFKILKKFNYFRHIDKIFRVRGSSQSRHDMFRLDKNERVVEFENYFIKNILKKINSNHLSAYPETESLYNIFSKKFNLNKDMFVLTAGADSAIKNCFDLLVKKGDKIITLSPTFGMVDVYAKLFQAKQVKIKFNNKLELNLNKMIKEINNKAKLIIIANPNSPTGTIIKKENLISILKKAKKNNCYVLIDEAYYGFYDFTFLKYIKKFKNLIIVRTFSKAYGLAGCRVGLIISDKATATRLYKYRPMYEINSISVLIIKEIMKNENILKKYIKETNEGKKYLTKKMQKLGFFYYNSYANFLLVDVKKEYFKRKVFNYLKKKKILIANETRIPGRKTILRFTLGPTKYMKQIVGAFNKIHLNQR